MTYLSRSVRENWIGPAEQQSRLHALAIQKAVLQARRHIRELEHRSPPVSYRGRAG